MAAPNDNGTNNPQTVTGGQFGVIIDGSTLNQNGVPAGTQILGPVTANADIVTTGNITADYFFGNISGNIANAVYAISAGTAEFVTNAAQPNITSVGTLTSLSVTGNVSTGGFFIGDGGLLSNITVGNVNANYANFAGTAFSVDAANIVGNVQYANVAFSVSGSNVSGAVAFATTANSVAGANVSGAVAFATTANSVAGANVSGEVAFAATANSVAGANVSGPVSDANFAETANTVIQNAQPNITSVGTLSSLSVSGNINTTGYVSANYFSGDGANLSNITTATANYANFAGNAFAVDGANVVGAVATANTALSVDGANVNGAVANATNAVTAQEVSNSSQPNITSVGTLSSLTMSGNITGANYVTANYFSGDGSLLTNVNVGNISNVNYANFAGVAYSVDAGNVVGNVAYANVALSVSGANVSGEVAFAATANSVSGSNVTGNVGNALYAYSVDGANVSGAVANAAFADGVNGSNVIGNVGNALYAYSVDGANVNGSVADAATATDAYNVLGNSQPNITSVGTLSSLSLTGNVTGANYITANFFSGDGSLLTNLNVGNATVANANYANIAGTAWSVDAGNIVGNVAYANVALSVDGANVSGEVAYAAQANSVAGANVSGEVATANVVSNPIQSNITAVGNLSSLSVVGNVTGDYFIGNGSLLTGITFTGNVSNANYANFAGEAYLVSGANVSGEVALAATANIANIAYSVDGANVSGAVALATLANTVSDAAQPNITSVGNLSSLTVVGNVTGDYFIGNGSLLTGITPAPSANANYANFAGTAFSVDAGNIVGDVANANYANIAGTAWSVDAGNIVGDVANANYANIAGTAWSVDAGNIVGNVAYANIAEFVANATQSNITAVGTLSSLSVSGNSNVGNLNAANTIVIANGSGGNISGANNVTANFFIGNGSLLTGIATGTPNAIVNGNSSVSIPTANANVNVSIVSDFNSTQFSTFVFENVGRLNITRQDAGGGTGAGVVINAYRNNTINTRGYATIRYRGNVTNPLGLQPNDILTTLVGVGYNGTALDTSGMNMRGRVDSNYVAGEAILPTRIELVTTANVGNVATLRTANFYSNGQFTPANNIVTISNSDHSLGNSVTSNYFVGNGSLLTGITTVGSSINNGNSNVSIPTIDGNVIISTVNSNNATLVNTARFNTTGQLAMVLPDTNVGSFLVANIYRNANVTSGIGSQRARGNLTTPQSLQGGDETFRIVAVGYNGTGFYGTAPAQFRAVVDSSYTAGNTIVPQGFVLRAVDSSAAYQDSNFYANGQFTPAGNIVTIANSDHSLGNSVTANFFVGNGSQLTSLPTQSIIANGTSNVSIDSANGNIVISRTNANNPALTNSITLDNNGRLYIRQPQASTVGPNSLILAEVYRDATNVVGYSTNRGRGNINNPLSVQPGDGVFNIQGFGHNGTSFDTNGPAVRGQVSSTYVANSTLIPYDIRMFTIDTTGNVQTIKNNYMYANGQFTPAGNIVTIANSDHSLGNSVTSNNVSVNNFLKVGVYTAAALTAITGVIGQLAVVSDSAGGGNPNGMLAFWDTTNNRWSYVHNNTAV